MPNRVYENLKSLIVQTRYENVVLKHQVEYLSGIITSNKYCCLFCNNSENGVCTLESSECDFELKGGLLNENADDRA